ncbi:hypothetical protein ACG873_30295 [Mesorhizobium sp. AaZ16]|uniref:hypothetical protein n=1 Tax=Mesorhizobium sp. AaZ16 TaxID=3402289 RepID=UPI00374F7EA2
MMWASSLSSQTCAKECAADLAACRSVRNIVLMRRLIIGDSHVQTQETHLPPRIDWRERFAAVGIQLLGNLATGLAIGLGIAVGLALAG